jgi:hypothetical protein
MHLEYSSSGGFGGLRLSTSVDTATLGGPAGAELAALVEQAGVWELPAQSPARSRAADATVHRLVVRDQGRSRELTFDDLTAPAPVRPLLERLRSIALERRGARP